ncbi:MAG TPA: RDD family protein [Acidimicrobiales bacterium]|jgi:uncharacterized RDD family membrane protein YckC|nr:RDD family protein [Acidimicrobiales bacterium]
MPRASFTQRALGRAIDIGLLCVLIVAALSGFVEDDANGDPRVDAPAWFLIALAVAVLAFESVPVRLRGQTLGKIITKTRIVRVVDGGRPGWGAALIRWGIAVAVLAVVGAFSPPAAIAAVAVLYASALIDPNGRGLLDRAAGTEVVRT